MARERRAKFGTIHAPRIEWTDYPLPELPFPPLKNALIRKYGSCQ